MEQLNAMDLFSNYMKMVGVPKLTHDDGAPDELRNKTIGLIHGGAWMSLWGYYFCRKYLPGVKIASIGNEAVQLNFMKAHAEQKPCPPQRNIDLFAEYARQLVELVHVDAIMVTCSTMNRSIGAVRAAVASYGVPVVQIDEPMMEEAAKRGGRTLVIATHGPTVESTKQLLCETAQRIGVAAPNFLDANIEECFALLSDGNVKAHNDLIAKAIREGVKNEGVTQVVLAQLSMSVFGMEYPDPVSVFGVPVFNSGDEGFKRMRSVLAAVKTKEKANA